MDLAKLGQFFFPTGWKVAAIYILSRFQDNPCRCGTVRVEHLSQLIMKTDTRTRQYDSSSSSHAPQLQKGLPPL